MALVYNTEEGSGGQMLQYIEEAKQGDRQAFEQIVKHFTPMANAVAFEKLRDYQLAEDAVQEAFTEAFCI